MTISRVWQEVTQSTANDASRQVVARSAPGCPKNCSSFWFNPFNVIPALKGMNATGNR